MPLRELRGSWPLRVLVEADGCRGNHGTTGRDAGGLRIRVERFIGVFQKSWKCPNGDLYSDVMMFEGNNDQISGNLIDISRCPKGCEL